jgi:hypothetical protein
VAVVRVDSSADIKSSKAALYKGKAIILRDLAQFGRRVVGLGSVCIVLLGLAWNFSLAEQIHAYGPLTVQMREAETPGNLSQRQVTFLQRLRQSDPRYETIQKAVFNTRNELGIVLDQRVKMDAIRPLLRTIIMQMARSFPRRDLMVIAYAPTQPPTEIGTARLQARTREMTYTPARPN